MTTVLIVDDDPSHLKLYSWILKRGGFRAVTALVGSNDVDLPISEKVDVAALDYRLHSSLTPIEVAIRVLEAFPAVPILVLTDLPWMPDDMAPIAAAYVNKGDPEKLLRAIAVLAEGRAFRMHEPQ